MNRQIKLAFIAVLVLAFAVGCATMNVEITPKAKLAYMFQMYNAQHEDYMNMAKMPNLTDAQKTILRAKKPVLETLQTLIPLYDTSIQAGAPSASTEQQIYNLLNQLQTMGG